MAYRCMLSLIKEAERSKEELLDMADVYYAAKRLKAKQYTEVVALIEAM